MPGMVVNAGPLFGCAKEAYQRTKGAASDRDPGQMDALVALVFSVAAAECFINEIAEIARLEYHPSLPPNPPSVKKFSTLFDKAGKDETGKYVEHRRKFAFAKESFTGKPYNRGAVPYQDFDLLIEVRDALVHSKPLDTFAVDSHGHFTFEPPHLLNKLRSKNIIAEPEPGVGSVWILTVATTGTARWACRSAAAMVQSIIMAVPEKSQFKDDIVFFYSIPFQLPQ